MKKKIRDLKLDENIWFAIFNKVYFISLYLN